MMFPEIRKLSLVRKLKPVLKLPYRACAAVCYGCFFWLAVACARVARFVFGIEYLNHVVFHAPKPFIKPILKSAGARVGKDTDISEHLVIANAAGGDYRHLTIADNCFIGKEVYLDLVENVEIGVNSTVSARVMLYTHEDPGPHNALRSTYPRKSAAVSIGSNAWIGAGVIILCGVRIGDKAVVGAGSLVRDDLPAGSVAAGMPAKLIR